MDNTGQRMKTIINIVDAFPTDYPCDASTNGAAVRERVRQDLQARLSSVRDNEAACQEDNCRILNQLSPQSVFWYGFVLSEHFFWRGSLDSATEYEMPRVLAVG